MSLHNTANQPQQRNNQTRPMPVGGFVIDAQGREVPITEEMIQHACEALEQSHPKPARKR